MPNRLYQDYIKVDPNFIPVFSRNSDQVYPDKWQSFFPHDSFKTILTSVIEMLEKGSETKDRSLWMNGAYGTGKTYASFTIKHIMEDRLDSVEPYFLANNMQALLARVKGVRSKGEVLVVHKSASADINSQNKLFNTITESVKDALRSKGYSYMGASSMMDKILLTLKDPDSAFNFRAAFNKYRARFTEYSSVDGVIADLEDLDTEDKLDLLDNIIKVAEDESYNWAVTPDEVINWVEDVRKGNGLYAIVFMWDEFTEYFRNNQNNITGLQEIAMASSRTSFYFFLITHSDANQLIADQAARKIIEARFRMYPIRIGENTAFKLLGQALRHEKDLDDEWKKTRDELWLSVKRGTADLIKDKDSSIQEDDFKNLLPMQPYTAYLLKFIAQDISSNQRTMFQFISGDYIEGDEERTNFKWFIDHYGYEYGKWNFLTADYLWDYFFHAFNVDLDSSFTDAASHYNTYEGICVVNGKADSSESINRMRVLKVALLLSALQTKNSSASRTGATSLLRPTKKNICSCFVGTSLENKVSDILDDLVDKGALGSIEDADKGTLYVMTTALIDKDRLAKMEEDARKAFPFEKLIADTGYDITKQFIPTDYLQYRCRIIPVTPSNARSEADITIEVNQIPTFYLFAKNEAEQGKVGDTIRILYSKFPERCVVVDFSSMPFTDARYEKFITSKGKDKYFGSIPNQKDQLILAKKGTDSLVQEWTRALVTSSLRVYSSASQSDAISGGANLRKKLKEINSTFYGAGLEEISVNDKLFEQSGYKDVVAKIAMGKESIPANYSYLRFISSPLEKDGIWGNPDYWTAQPNHVISRMKIAVEEVINRGFSNNSMVCVTDIWKVLKKPPFGLLPCTGAVFLMAFLLKEYADSSYYKRDINNNTVGLNYSDLCELIYGIVKDMPKAKNQFIVKQKPEHSAFCQTTGEIFKIAKDKRNSIDDIAKSLNIYLTNNNYPLWALKSYVLKEMYDHEMCDPLVQLIDLFCEFVNPESRIGRDKTKVAEDIYALYLQTPGLDAVTSDIVTDKCLRSGMVDYIAEQKPELTQIASSLKLEDNEYLSLLNKKLSSDSSYLWQKGDIDNQITSLYIDLRLIRAINRVISTPQKYMPEAKATLIEKLNIIKIPDDVLQEGQPALKPIMQQFYAIKNEAVVNRETTADIIDSRADDFLSFFNNQYETFAAAVLRLVDSNVTAEEINHLFENVDAGTLFKKTDEFSLSIKRTLETFRKNMKTHQMFESWKIITKTDNPSEWSKEHRIPILCAFSDSISVAQTVFAALNKTALLPNESSIDDAIAFINGGCLKRLENLDACTQEFINFFCGDYSYIIDDADGLREVLRAVAGKDIYEWYSKQAMCKGAIKKLATDRYQLKYRSKVRDELHNLTAKEAQEYLEKLIEDDPLLGISILKKSK